MPWDRFKTRAFFALKVVSVLGLLAILVILYAGHEVDQASSDLIFSDVGSVPSHEVALVLGCRKVKDDHVNAFFKHRVGAAAALYKAGKVKHILVSGDNHSEGYDEPTDLCEALVGEGVPRERITLDYAGFRTLDSVVRAEAVFGLKKFIMVSQKDHLRRAIFLARGKGLTVMGYEAKGVSGRWRVREILRESVARVKAVMDLAFDREPRFYGPRVEIGKQEPEWGLLGRH